jgi:type II secretory pathway component PulF
MPNFKYQAVDAGGVRSAGELSAETKEAAISELAVRGLLVAKIGERRDASPLLNRSASRVGLVELERFTSELALLLRNGVRIDKGLMVLVRNTRKPAELRFLRQVCDDVRSGENLSHALERFPELFSDTYLNLVRTGEASGRLDEVFSKLGQDIKYRRRLQNQIIQALSYPTVILVVCLLSIGFVFNYIVPQMAPLFAGATTLPSYTVLLLAVSDWLRSYQIYLFAVAPLLGFLVVRFFSSRSQREKTLSRIMHWPIVGSMVLLVNQVQANSTMSITLASGLPIDRAMGLAANSVINKELKHSLLASQERIRRGDSVTNALSGNPMYPDFAHSLIEVGEESGDLQPCFEELAERARVDFELRIVQLTSILEPLLILFMGAIVGGVVVTMLLSVVSVNDIAI